MTSISSRRFMVPSGKLSHSELENHHAMGKSTISMVMFNSFLYVYQRVDIHKSPYFPYISNKSPYVPPISR